MQIEELLFFKEYWTGCSPGNIMFLGVFCDYPKEM